MQKIKQIILIINMFTAHISDDEYHHVSVVFHHNIIGKDYLI